MNFSGNRRRRAIRHKSTRFADTPSFSVSKWYPLALVLHYWAYAGERLVQTGAGETIEISSRGLRLRIPDEIPSQVTEMRLAIAWPVLLNGVTPLQWSVKAKPVWRSIGWLFVGISSHEFRTAGARRREQVMVACG